MSPGGAMSWNHTTAPRQAPGPPRRPSVHPRMAPSAHVGTLGPSGRPQPPPANSVIGPIRLIGPIYHPPLHPRPPTIPSRPSRPRSPVPPIPPSHQLPATSIIGHIVAYPHPPEKPPHRMLRLPDLYRIFATERPSPLPLTGTKKESESRSSSLLMFSQRNKILIVICL